MKRILLFFAALTALCAAAQPAATVEWSLSVDSLAPDRGVAHITATIADGYHIYGLPAEGNKAPKPTTVSLAPAPGLIIDGPLLAGREAVTHTDPDFGAITWFEGSVSFEQPFSLAPGCDGARIEAVVEFMACTATACTPPASERLSATFGNAPDADAPGDKDATPAAADGIAPQAAAPAVPAGVLEQWWAPVQVSTGGTAAEGSSWPMILLFGFFGGLLALLTPCVWPMIPMTMSFFLKKGKNRRRAIADSITYGLSIIAIFLILGIALTMVYGAGKLNEIATSAVFNLIFFALLVVFAISFFGAFDIKLPSKWSNAIDSRAERTSGLLSIFFMAFTLVLVSFSCTGPIIGTLLVEAASQGSIIGPAVGMGGFALGLALPFGLFAFFPSMLKEMPRSGGWLNSVKVVLGFIELILSLKFLSVADLAYGWRILDREVFIALWIVLFALLGMYLLGKLRFSHDSPSQHTSVGGFFLALCSFSFAVYLLPGLWGAPLKSISAFAPPLHTQDFNLYGGTFREYHDYDEGMLYARNNNLPVLVDFSGYACVNCRKMEGAVFDTPGVRSIIEQKFVLIKLMVDDKTPLATPYTVEEYGRTRRIATVGDRWSYLQRRRFDISSQPFYIMLDNNGTPLAQPRVYDEDADAFAAWLEAGAASYRKLK